MPDLFSSFGRALDSDLFRGLGTGVRRVRPKDKDELTDKEKSSILRELASPALSGLAYLGETLDKPGAAVRGLLAGKPQALLNLIPFSDYLGVTDPKKRTYGRALLEQYGVLGRNKKGLDWGDVAGFGAEVLTDPLSYVGLPGVSKALNLSGKAAQKSGLLRHAARVATEQAVKKAPEKAIRRIGPREAIMTMTPGKTLAGLDDAAAKAFERAAGGAEKAAKLMDEPFGGLWGSSAYPVGPTKWTFGKGETALEIAKVLDRGGRAIRYGKYSPVRAVAARLHKPTAGAFTETQQRVAQELSDAAEPTKAAAREKWLGDAVELYETGLDPAQKNQFMAAAEGVDRGFWPKSAKPLPAKAEELAARIGPAMESLQTVERYTGVKSPELEELQNLLHGYLPLDSHAFKTPLKTGRGFAAHEATIGGSAKQRQDWLRGHPAGHSVIQELSQDANYSGIAHKEVEGAWAFTALKKNELDAKVSELLLDPKYKGRLKEFTTAREKRYFVQRLSQLDPRHVAEQVPFYDTDTYLSILKREQVGQKAVSTTAAMQRALAMHAMRDTTEFTSKPVSLSEALHKIGIQGAPEKVADEAATFAGKDRLIEQLENFSKEIPNYEELRKWYVPSEIVDEMTRLNTPFRSPKEISSLGKAMDGFMDWWRASVTISSVPGLPGWPAFAARNQMSGLINDWFVAGGNPLTIARNAKAVYALRHTGKIPNPLNYKLVKDAGITNVDEANRFLARQYGVYEVSTPRSGQGLERATRNLPTPALATQVPGVEKSPGLGSIFGRAIPRSLGEANPFRLDTYSSQIAGRMLSEEVEAMNRGALWLTLTDQGYSAAEAARKTTAAQVAYQNLPPAGQQLRRVFPFYSFTSGMAKFLAEELMQRPGGRLAQSIRASNVARERDPFVPDYLSQTMAIPIPEGTPLIGPKPGGDPRYLGGMGLMHEDPLQFLGGGPGAGGTVRGLLQELGSRMGPASKPIEFATGTSFFQAGPRGGRALEDMDPTIGRLLANVTGRDRPVKFPGSELVEQAAMTTMPRPLTTARTLSDPRKRMEGAPLPGPAALTNVLTGMRVYDLPQRTQEAMIREALEEALKSTGVARTFAKTYVPKELLEELPEAERREVQRMGALSSLLGERATQRKKGERLAPVRTW